MLKHFLKSILHLGLDGQIESIIDSARVRLINGLTLLCILLTALGFFIALYLELSRQALLTFSGILFTFLPVFWLHHKRQYSIARLQFAFATTVLVILLVVSAFSDRRFTQTEDIFIGQVLVMVIVFDGRTKHLLSLAIFTIYFTLKWVKFSLLGLPHDAYFAFTMLNVVVAFASVYIFTDFFKVELQQTQKSLEQLNKDLQNKNVLVEAQNERLKHTERELVELNQTKDKLFSILAHDLRSPLNSLTNLLMLIQDEQITQEDFKQLSRQLSDTLEQNQHLLNNLLHWSMEQIQGKNYEPESFVIAQTIEENVRLFGRIAQSKGVELRQTTLASEALDMQVWADRNSIDLVLRNILSNAIKFTPRGKNVYIQMKKIDDAQLRISVKDEGIGMSQEKIDKLWQGLNQSQRGTQNEKGTGLGLWLVREFVEKNQGQLRVNSEEGKGSVFSFTLPITKSLSDA